MAPGLEKRSTKNRQSILPHNKIHTPPEPLQLPIEIFLLLGTHLDTQALSRLSRTSRALNIFLTPNLKRHRVFRLVGTYLCCVQRWECGMRSSILRLSRTSRTLHHALAPLVRECYLDYAPTYIHQCIRSCLSLHVELDICLAAIGPLDQPSRLNYQGIEPLAWAVTVRYPNETIVRVLLDHGFNPHGVCPSWNAHYVSPLDLALSGGHLGIARMMFKKGGIMGGVFNYQGFRLTDEVSRLLREYWVKVKEYGGFAVQVLFVKK